MTTPTTAEGNGCPFCDYDGSVLFEAAGVFVIEPLHPVTEGHLLVIPRRHVEDYTTDPALSASVMLVAASRATRPSNLITSAGAEATQTVKHLHLHIVPRRAGDRLALPWSEAAARAEAVSEWLAAEEAERLLADELHCLDDELQCFRRDARNFRGFSRAILAALRKAAEAK